MQIVVVFHWRDQDQVYTYLDGTTLSTPPMITWAARKGFLLGVSVVGLLFPLQAGESRLPRKYRASVAVRKDNGGIKTHHQRIDRFE